MKKIFSLFFVILIYIAPEVSKADLFGADVGVLVQILSESIEEVLKLQQILNNGKDTLGLLQDINSGVKSGLDIIRIINPKFNPGLYGDLRDPANVLHAIQDLYGKVPNTADHGLMEAQDQSVAEVIAMNRNLYDYADQADQERSRILAHSEVVSPQGAAKLQNQSLAVLIGVMTQLLRTQSQMLKIMAQGMAFQNRKEKIESQQFIENYQGVSQGLQGLPTEVKLPELETGGAQ